MFKISHPLRLASLIALTSTCWLSAQTSYYWKEGFNANLPSSWGTNLDGTGASPSFSADDILLTVQTGQDLNTFSNTISLSGTGSYVVLESGATMTASGYDHNISLNMSSGSFYEVSSSYSNLTINEAATDSTFIISGSLSSIREYSYGSLDFNSTSNANTQTLTTTGDFTISQGKVRASAYQASGTHTIGGDINIESLGTYEFGTTSSDTPITGTINVAGDLNNSGVLDNRSAYVTATLNFTGTESAQANWGTHSGTFSVGIDANKSVTFNDSLTTEGGDLTVGGTLQIADGQTVDTDAGDILIDGTLASAEDSTGVITLDSDGDITFSDSSVISLALGNGSHSSLNITGSGTVTFDADQSFFFFDNDIVAGTYENIITGLSLDPGVAGWTIANSDLTGGFTFDGSNVDLNISTIPEPAMASLAICGVVAGLSLVRRRRTRDLS